MNSSQELHPIVASPLVSIIVLNWNGEKYLPRCLDAIAKQTFTDYEVIIIDNASTDHSVDHVEQHWPGFQVVRLDENLGFAIANNLGAKIARGNWVALLNNDAYPRPEWLENMMKAIQNYPMYSFFASCILQADDPDLIENAGDIYHISGLAWPRRRNATYNETPLETDEVFSACAAAALYKREAFLQVGGFNEKFFSHHEDVDLGFRLRLQGYRCLFVPEAVVLHVGSASFGFQSDKVVYQVNRNLVWSFVSNMPGWLFWKYLPAHIISNLIFLLYYTFRHRASAIWRAKFDALRGLPAAIEARKLIQKNRKVKDAEISQAMDHNWLNPYTLGNNAERIRRLGRALGLDPQHEARLNQQDER
jgi:GT2 family glycosyltransferase